MTLKELKQYLDNNCEDLPDDTEILISRSEGFSCVNIIQSCVGYDKNLDYYIQAYKEMHPSFEQTVVLLIV